MLIGCYDEYRPYLRDVLNQRQRSNPHYSLRAFARDLRVAPPQLSEVLNARKGLSMTAAARISTQLGHTDEQRSYFCDLVQKEDARSPAARQLAALRLSRFAPDTQTRVLALDTYKVIADWWHYAILELTFVDGFKSKPEWIAKALGIPEEDARAAIERLLALGLLAKDRGRLVKSDGRLTTTDGVRSDAIRATNRQLLDKARAALDEQELAERDFSSMTMAIDPTKLPEAKQMIARFRRELCEFLESGPQSDVYTLTVQLFRLSERP